MLLLHYYRYFQEEKSHSVILQEEIDRLNDEIIGRDEKIKELVEQLNQLQEKYSQDKELTELFKIQGIIFGYFVI